MAATLTAPGAAIRAKLSHPVIDADGHWREFPPLLTESLKRIGGDKATYGLNFAVNVLNRTLGAEFRQRMRIPRGFWWVSPGNTLDRATSVFPRLLYERLDEFGLDFVTLYPTYGIVFVGIPDDESRRITCRAYNTYLADEFREFSDRITPAAVVPMHTPEEAIAELEHVKALGLKVAMMGCLMRRANAAALESPEYAPLATWYDPLGLDSAYDYDPVWAKCEELGLAPTFHGGTAGLGIGLRTSPGNMCFNHIGSFAAAGEAVCKALFIGGVTRRFPRLRFAFLEGGVGWACNLYSDLISHWKVRSISGVRLVSPARLDREQFLSLAQRYAGERWAEYLKASPNDAASLGQVLMIGGEPPEQLDDYERCAIKSPEEFRDLFASRFYFGCEAEDPINAWAFNSKVNPYEARLNALFSSDISHFDVADMRDVLPEAYELVEKQLLSESDFRDFTFANAVRFFANGNQNFFENTVVDKAARAVLAEKAAS
jgi:predicted TIM-barrel fold metal-dependent hydrolase